jgi:hypothetical protein
MKTCFVLSDSASSMEDQPISDCGEFCAEAPSLTGPYPPYL